MTETEWLTSARPEQMLRYLQGGTFIDGEPARLYKKPKLISDRKLRLFACACCRQVWDRLTDPRSRKAVKAAERFADGEATWNELERADRRHDLIEEYVPCGFLADLCGCHRPAQIADLYPARDREVPPALQAALLRDLVGNPFRPISVETSPGSWAVSTVKGTGELTYQQRTSPTVLTIARRAYDDRNFAALPILADALADAGCESEDILRHLRGQERCLTCAVEGGEAYPVGWCPVCDGTEDKRNGGWMPLRGPHARGCWALDLILGKE